METEESNLGDLRRDAAVQGGDGRFTIDISPEWCVWSPQGGYLMAVVLRAAAQSTVFGRPLSLACHFLSVPKTAPAELHVSSLRKSRVAESLRVSMQQDGRGILEALVWAGDGVEGYEHEGAVMPDVPLVDTLTTRPAVVAQGGMHTLWKNIDHRPCGPLSFERETSTDPRQRDWMRLRAFEPTADGFIEAGRQALFLDTFSWPAAAHAHVGDGRFISPTLSFSIDFHRGSTSEWLLSDAHSPHASGGCIAVHDRLWSPKGELVASACATMICRPRPGRS